jgi:hypothetical protein
MFLQTQQGIHALASTAGLTFHAPSALGWHPMALMGMFLLNESVPRNQIMARTEFTSRKGKCSSALHHSFPMKCIHSLLKQNILSNQKTFKGEIYQAEQTQPNGIVRKPVLPRYNMLRDCTREIDAANPKLGSSLIMIETSL